MSVARTLSVLILAVIAATLPAANAGSAPKQGKDYNFAVADAPAGDSEVYSFTLTNRAGTQQIGSANVTIPSTIGLRSGGVTASVSPSGTAAPSATNPRVIELRGLALLNDQSATVTIEGLEMPCVGFPEWAIPLVKQSNDFSGEPGNGLTFRTSGSDRITDLTGKCRLDFAAQPEGAQKTEPIRSAGFNPDGPAVQVRALDAEGDPVPALDGPVAIGLVSEDSGKLSQPATDPVDDGAVLSYFGLSIDLAGTYKLTAGKTGYDGALSRAFPIVDEAQACDHQSCRAKLDGPRASTTLEGVLAAGDPGHAVLSRATGTRPDCDGYVSPLGLQEWYEFALTVFREKTVTVTYSKPAMQSVPGGASALEICLSSPEPFTAKGGTKLFNYDDLDGDPLDGFVGLLSDCADAGPGQPCIQDRASAGGGRAIVMFFIPARLGDPRCR